MNNVVISDKLDAGDPPSQPVLAIVSTIVDSRGVLDDWLSYHRRIGVGRFYLFFDDDDQDALDAAEGYDDVRCYRTQDRQVKEAWSLFKEIQNPLSWQLLYKEVMARQESNARLAAEIARRDNCRWLLHIDLDELFFPNGVDLTTHFRSLEANLVGSMVFLNYEGIALSDSIASPFREVNYFKKNFLRKKHWMFNAAQRQYLRGSVLPQKYFNFYQNGKCAVFLDNDIRVVGVHEMHCEQMALKLGAESDPLVLHYPCLAYDDFVRKYRRLGNFSDHWRGKKRTGIYCDSFHTDARDAVQFGDANTLKDFFRKKVVVDSETVQGLVALDMAQKIDFACDLLRQVEPKYESAAYAGNYDVVAEAASRKRKRPPVIIEEGCNASVWDIPTFLQTQFPEKALWFRDTGTARSWIRLSKARLAEEYGSDFAGGKAITIPPAWDVNDETIAIDFANRVGERAAQLLVISGLPRLTSVEVAELNMGMIWRKRVDWVLNGLHQTSINAGVLFLDDFNPACLAPGYLSGLIAGAVDHRLPGLIEVAVQQNTTLELILYLTSVYHQVQSTVPRFARFSSVIASLEAASFEDRLQWLHFISMLNMGWIFDQRDNELWPAEVRDVKSFVKLRHELETCNKLNWRFILQEQDGLMCILGEGDRLRVLALLNFQGETVALTGQQISKYGLHDIWRPFGSAETAAIDMALPLPPKRLLLLKTDECYT